MDDLIDRQQAIDEFWKLNIETRPSWIDAVMTMLKSLPSAQPERKRGEWIKEPWHSDNVRQCSACHVTQTVTTHRGIVNFKFCPYCGVDMRGEQDEAD